MQSTADAPATAVLLRSAHGLSGGTQMRTVIAGGGPVGIYAALALARRGHQVTVVDRDPGRAAEGEWRRLGVMQFEHAHGWRPQVLAAFRAEAPDVLDALLAAGLDSSTCPACPRCRPWPVADRSSSGSCASARSANPALSG